MTNHKDELTEYGILTNYPDVTMPDLRYVHGDRVLEYNGVEVNFHA